MPFVGSVEGKMGFGRPTATSSNIVTTNLVLNLDAGNMASYSGSGTTWRDMTSGLNFTLTNGPTYSSSNGGLFKEFEIGEAVDWLSCGCITRHYHRHKSPPTIMRIRRDLGLSSINLIIDSLEIIAIHHELDHWRTI